MRWLFWVGSFATIGGLWWLFQGVDLAGGGTDQTTLLAGALVFLIGMVLVGFGLGAGVGRE